MIFTLFSNLLVINKPVDNWLLENKQKYKFAVIYEAEIVAGLA